MKVLLLVLLSVAVASAATIGASPNPKPVAQRYVDQIQTELENMVNRWQFLDDRCDPLAVFSLTYIYMTRSLRDTVKNLYFDDNELMSNFTLTFAKRYADAIDVYLYNTYGYGTQPASNAGLTIPWNDTFAYAGSYKSSAMEDLLLGMNAHINYDLSRVVYDMRYGVGSAITGYPYKNDYDRINDILNAMVDPISTDLANRYDQTLGSPLVGFLSPAILELLISWRTNAWYNGLAMQNAITPVGFQAAQTNTLLQTMTIAATSQSYNAAGLFASTRAARVAWCEAHHNTDIDYAGP